MSRSIALAIVSVVAVAGQSVPWLAAVAVAMVLVQAGDALDGRTERHAVKTTGPAATALLNLAALVWMLQWVTAYSFRRGEAFNTAQHGAPDVFASPTVRTALLNSAQCAIIWE